MAEWRVGRKLGRTLYRDEQLVGMVDSPEIAAEIVACMRAVNRLLGDDEVAMNASSEPLRCPAETGSLVADGHVHTCSWPTGGRHVHHCACGADWMETQQPESARERSLPKPPPDTSWIEMTDG